MYVNHSSSDWKRSMILSILNFRKWSAILAVYNLIALSKEHQKKVLAEYSHRYCSNYDIVYSIESLYQPLSLQMSLHAMPYQINPLKKDSMRNHHYRKIEGRAFLHVCIIIISFNAIGFMEGSTNLN